MKDQPEPRISRNQAFLDATIIGRWRVVLPRCHGFHDFQEIPCDVEVILVASMVEGDKDGIGQAPPGPSRRIARWWIMGHRDFSLTPGPPPFSAMNSTPRRPARAEQHRASRDGAQIHPPQT